MSKDDVYDLLMGVAVVALGYAIYQHRKASAPRNTGVVGPAIDVPPPPEIHGDESTGYWWEPDNLLAGVY